MNKKRALITGGAGFIGAHLCEALLKEGYRVFCLDNLITGSLKNIEHLVSQPGFDFIRADANKHIKIKGRLDYVLHFASLASPADYLRMPIQTLEVGAQGTHNTLELAKAKKAKFIFASTSEVYGDPLLHPQPESYWGNVNSVGIRGCYDESKRFGEALTMAYNRMHKVDTRIARIFNTYGPRTRMNDGRVVPNFIYQALNNKPLTVYGKGTQTRSFCYIQDLIEGIIRLMSVQLHNPVNLGNPREFSILKLAHLILELTGSKSKIIFRPLPEDDPRQRRPDITLARRVLHWQPRIGIKEGLRKTIESFKNDESIFKRALGKP